jgi:hypothetical protein
MPVSGCWHACLRFTVPTAEGADVGAWGCGPFENDDALDLLVELGDAAAEDQPRRIRLALILPEGYVQVSASSAAVAAAALVAAANGMPLQGPAEAAGLVQSGAVPVGDEVRQLAGAALVRVAGDDSEWRELWDEAGLLTEAASTLEQIQAHL